MPDSMPSTEFLDTCVLARYLVQDDAAHGARAAALIDSDRPLRIGVVVLAELGFLLTNHYAIDRSQVVDAMLDLLYRHNIEPHEVSSDLVAEALGMCRGSGRVSFADALTWAAARSAGRATIWSYDRRFPSTYISVREP